VCASKFARHARSVETYDGVRSCSPTSRMSVSSATQRAITSIDGRQPFGKM
jgi:hypothetical protein